MVGNGANGTDDDDDDDKEEDDDDGGDDDDKDEEEDASAPPELERELGSLNKIIGGEAADVVDAGVEAEDEDEFDEG